MFPVTGYFSVSSAREVGSRNRRMEYGDAGHCLIVETSEDAFELSCEQRRRKPYGGIAKRGTEGLVINWSDGTEAVYNPDTNGTSLNAQIGDRVHFLRRIAPFGPNRLAEIASALPFEGRHRLTADAIPETIAAERLIDHHRCLAFRGNRKDRFFRFARVDVARA